MVSESQNFVDFTVFPGSRPCKKSSFFFPPSVFTTDFCCLVSHTGGKTQEAVCCLFLKLCNGTANSLGYCESSEFDLRMIYGGCKSRFMRGKKCRHVMCIERERRGMGNIDTVKSANLGGTYMCVLCVCLVSQSCLTLFNPVDCSSLSMRVSRQEYWSGLPFPTPGYLPHPGIEPASPVAPALLADSFTAEPQGKP